MCIDGPKPSSTLSKSRSQCEHCLYIRCSGSCSLIEYCRMELDNGSCRVPETKAVVER